MSFGFSLSDLILLASTAFKILEDLNSLSRATREEKSIISEIAALHGVLLALDQHPQLEQGVAALPPGLTGHCGRTLEEITEIYQKILNRRSKSRFQIVFQRLIDKERIEQLKSELDRHKATFSVILSVYSTFHAASANEEIKVLHTRLEEIQKLNIPQILAYEERLQARNEIERKHRILDWISAYDFSARHFRQASTRVPGSCEWFLKTDVFQRWHKGSNRGLIVYGLPGSGKSTICSMVVDTITSTISSNEAIAYFYADFADEIPYSKLLGCLLRQFLERCQYIPEEISRSFDQRGTGTLDHIALEQMLLSAFSTFSQSYICIDAIDELDRTSIELLSSLLSRVLSALVPVRIILFSRYLLIPEMLESSSSLDLEYFYIDRHKDTGQDIKIFVDSVLDKSRHLTNHDDVKQELSKRAAAKADGMCAGSLTSFHGLADGELRFLWVRLALNDLIQEKSPKAMMRALDRYPASLHDIYERMWRLNQDQRTEDLIVLLLLAPCPLRTDDLEDMVNEAHQGDESFDSEKWSIRTCGFIFVGEDQLVHFVHSTAVEFLKLKGILETDNTMMLRAILQRKLQQKGYQQEILSDAGLHSQVSVLDSIGKPETLDDDATSSISWTDSVFTDASSVTSHTSQQSHFSQLESISEQYAKLFMDQKGLKSVTLEFLNTKGRESFEGYFPRLLMAYSTELQNIAITPSQKVAALMAGQNTAMTAHHVVLLSGFLDISKVFSGQTTSEELAGRQLMLERYLELQDRQVTDSGSVPSSEFLTGVEVEKSTRSASRASQPGILAPNLGNQVDSKDQANSTFSHSLPVDHDDGEIYVNLQKINTFLISRQPFRDIEERMRKALHAPSILPPVEASVKADPDLVRGRIWYIRILQKVASMLLRIVPGGERRLEPGMKRVRWTCLSKRQYYDDFYEVRPGAVKDLQQELNRIFPVKEGRKKSSWLSMPVVFSLGAFSAILNWEALILGFLAGAVLFLSLLILLVVGLLLQPEPYYAIGFKNVSKAGYSTSISATAISGEVQTLKGPRNVEQSSTRQGGVLDRRSPSTSRVAGVNSVDITDQDAWLDDDSDSSNSYTTANADRTGNADPQRQVWLLPLFLNSKDEAKVVHVNATRRNTDFSLFCGLREKYFMVSSAWTRLFKLHQVSAIRIVRFNLTGKRRGDILQKNTWPPGHTPRVWLYDPYPANAETVPLVSSNYLMWIWQDVLNADRAAFEEFWQNGSWRARFLHWLRNVPHRCCQSIRQALARIEEWDDEPTELNVLPAQVHPTDMEQPEQQARSDYAIRRLPKKLGGKLICDFRSNQYPEGWGIEFEEAFRIHRLLFFTLVFYALASLATLLYLWDKYGFVEPRDITPTAWLSIIGWVFSFTSLTFTVWFKWAELRISQ